MIVVTGATGQLGTAVVRHLLERLPAGDLIASVRDPAKATALAERGVTIRAGDFDDPQSLRSAFAGATQVLIVSADKLGTQALRMHRNAIQAAAAAGARRVLYTSHAGARPDSQFAPAEQHAGTEADLQAGDLAFTALRHGFYAESCLHMIGDGLRSGELRVPEDGPVAWTARDDLAAADAAILAEEGRIDGISPPMTAAEALTMADIAALASEASGSPIRHVTVSDEAWRAAKVTAGMPAVYADMLLGTFRAARRGDFARVDPTLPSLIGRPPRGMRAILTAFFEKR
ncbi:NAD(P)H-binding protein [Aurantimonas sp. MSK8Z-1]|uniref:NmrA family NAD(P)-binding protein n=1 Tax=Mangrovibrevibacter kandeliae TaxID=2968473 RepID=UPI0021179610|nr:NAD(P)H-binding protein [Aurantimonas sp. MSK8Z-1]MCW4116470.1 NAD(P)H-binding protein [Aurantimonas sp. MSK8Z-1]